MSKVLNSKWLDYFNEMKLCSELEKEQKKVIE
jgi:hypothetical protein